MYYHVVGESRNSYARLVFLNELVSGQDRSYLDDLFIKEKEPTLRFDQDKCRICLLGLRKCVYSGVFGLTTNDYMQLYIKFERRMQALFAECGYSGEIFLHLYADKQIIMIVSPAERCRLSVDELFQDAQNYLQAMYSESFLKTPTYCNQTYYLGNDQKRGDLSATLKKLLSLSKLNYFFMEPITLTPEKLDRMRVEPEEADVQELTQGAIAAASFGDFETFDAILRSLMLGKIKYSFNEYRLRDTAAALKRFYLQCSSAYDIPVGDDVDKTFDPRAFPTIEVFTEALLARFAECVRFINLREQRYSRLMQLALRVIKTSFCKWDISLTYVASQIHVSPAYLSSLFNREVGMNIARYIQELRIEKAKTMLAESAKRVADIAKAVGYDNKRYFSEVFKKKVGATPKEYREKLRETGPEGSA